MLTNIRSEAKNIDLLLQWSIRTDQPLGWRSAWLLRQVLKKNDPLLQPYIPKAIDLFTTFNESQKREWLKLLELQTMNEDEEGVVFDICMTEWRKIQNHPALRASAVNIIFNILIKYPELTGELSHLMTNEFTEPLSPGIQKGVIKRWSSINK